MAAADIKRCAKCRMELPADNFRKDKSIRCGLRSYCKECDRKDDRERRLKAELNATRLRELLTYFPETGVFTWNIPVKTPSKRGDAGVLDKRDGRIKIKIGGVVYQAHRLAWLYVHGEWPKKYIDHINQVPTDNRIENLRDVDAITNCQNRRRHISVNQAGRLGVSTIALPGGGVRFAAYIGHEGRMILIGKYPTVDEASAAYFAVKQFVHKGFIDLGETCPQPRT